MNPLPNSPRSTVADTNAGLANTLNTDDASESSDDSSASAGREQPAPRMQQPQEDVMQIDSDDDEDSHRALKRKWSETSVVAIPTGRDRSAVSSEPEFKRQRTSQGQDSSDCSNQSSSQSLSQSVSADKAKPSSTAPPPPALWFDVVRDADFVELILRRGGQPSGPARGRSVELYLPPVPSIEFRVAYFCLQLQSLRKNLEFPSKEHFTAQAASEFAILLQETSLADKANLVRQLFDTGYPAPPELIDPLLAAAMAAEAHRAAEVLQGTMHTPSGARAAEDLADSVIFSAMTRADTSALPPPAWREQVKANFDSDDIDDLLKCFAPGGDQEQGLSMLFGPPKSRPVGVFLLKKIFFSHASQRELLETCGAVSIGETNLNTWHYLCAGDFCHQRLEAALISAQADEDDDTEITALKFAIQWSDPDIVRSLLTNGARPRQTDQGESALHYAARSGNVAILDMLIVALSETLEPAQALVDDLNLLDDLGKTPLYLAAEWGFYKICERLLCKGALPIPAAAAGNGHLPMNPLVIAAKNGDAALCTLLVMHGGDVNSTGASTNRTPLQTAAKGGHLHACKTLLALGADVLAATDSGKTALSLAVSGGHLDVVRYLLDHGASPNKPSSQRHVLRIAFDASQNPTEMLTLLLDHGAHVNQRDERGNTPLIEACRIGSAKTVELLLSRGADPNLIGSRDEDPLEIAATDISKVELLIRHDVQLHAGGRGLRALYQAAAATRPDVVALLLKHGVVTDPLSVGLSQTDNPLLAIATKKAMHAASTEEGSRSTLDILSSLLQRGTPIHHTGSDGNDLLMAASYYLYTPCITSLLQHGARIGQVNTDGNHALQIVIKRFEEFSTSEIAGKAAEVFTILLAQTYKQDNSRALWSDAIHTAKNPVLRDMLRFSVIWTYPESEQLGQIRGLLSTELADSYVDYLIDHLATDRQLVSREALLRGLRVRGFTQPVINELMSFIDAYPDIQAALSGNMPSTSRRTITLPALLGWMASMESVLVRPDGDWQPYPACRFGAKNEAILTEIARGLIARVVDGALAAEEACLASSYAELFESCLAQIPQPWVVDGQLAPLQLAKSSIACKLVEGGIYAPIAERIEDAWRIAWASVHSASVVTATMATTAALTESIGPASRSGMASVDDAWAAVMLDAMGADAIFDGLSDFLLEAPPGPLPAPEPFAPTVPFVDTPLATRLQEAFRRELNATINSSSGNILKLPGAEQLPQEKAAAAQAVYETLTMRQLHMLAQFIDPGMLARETQEYAQRVQRLATSSAAMT